MTSKIDNYADFFLFYLSEHAKASTRLIHYVGTLFALGCLLSLVLTSDWRYLLLALIVAYGLAWTSHFFIERNRPATFTYPFWSYLADHHMLFLALTGQLRSQLAAAEQRYPDSFATAG